MDRSCFRRALANVYPVVYLVSDVGVWHSMYAITRYTATNELGTATLFEQLLEQPVRRAVTASSMSIYGEGLYRSADARLFEDVQRQRTTGGSWDPVDAAGRPLTPLQTPESKRHALAHSAARRVGTARVAGSSRWPAEH